MLSAKDHELLAQTGRGTRMGELLRRYWVPALLSEELPEPGGAPVRVKLLGERLVAVRLQSGQVGLLGEQCSHRGASLFFGQVEPEGMRCSYHGWKYDLAGRCIEMPNEPPSSTFKDRIQHPAYPCQERGGIVWAYLGPPDACPPLPDLEYLSVPESHVFASKRLQACHWTQCLDGDVDSSHVPFLHGSVLERRGEGKFGHQTAQWMLRDRTPKIEVVDTPGGLMIGSRRHADPDTYYWRINHWLMPWYTFIPAFTGDGPLAGHAWIPIDDTSTWVYTFTWHPTRPLTDQEIAEMRRGNANYAELIPGTYMPRHNASNGYNADLDPSADTPFRRIKTIQEQDMAMTESMGPLYDRTKERLASADLALIQVRRRLIQAAKEVAKGGVPPALDPAAFRVRQLSVVLPRTVVNWPEAVMEHIEARPETFVPSA
jgi:phenylpropionate dioxygenase-like ring-hydroxylating dioxygenase large terminal subunit